MYLRERANHYMDTSAFVFSATLVSLPIAAIIALLFGAVAYFFVGLANAPGAFFTFCLVVMGIQFAANGFVAMMSAIIPSAITAVTSATTLYAFMFLFCGIFKARADIPAYWIWLHYISIFKHGFEALMINQFRSEDSSFACDRVSSALVPNCRLSGGDVLGTFDIRDQNLWQSVFITFGLGLGYRVIHYFLLRFTIRPRV